MQSFARFQMLGGILDREFSNTAGKKGFSSSQWDVNMTCWKGNGIKSN